jgi:sugar phosphate isomerase/epimerase
MLTIAGGMTVPLFQGANVRADARKPKSNLGIADFSYALRKRAERAGDLPKRVSDPLGLLMHCQEIGAGGIQCGLGRRDADYARQLRAYAEKHALFVEGSTSLPRDPQDVERFDAHLRTAGAAGARIVRIAIGGRRYEQFDKLEAFRAFTERSWKSMQLAAPIAERHRLHLAIENHKDFRAPEMLRMLEQLDSEYVGICLDTGNSIALLEDPVGIIHTWTPWAKSVHLKDMAVCEYEEGFLLADVVLGEGVLDLPAIVGSLRKGHPHIQFSLEMATRDPLKVPCLTPRFWTTLSDVSGSELARTLRFVRGNARERQALPRVSHLPEEEQIRIEEENIRKCLCYASERLGL